MNNISTDEYAKLLKQSLVAIDNLKKQLEEKENSKEPIAIVGMGCHFPGDCNSPEEFWEFIKQGKDGVVDIPADRWNIDDYYSPVHGEPGKMYIKQGNFLQSDLKGFDAKYFKISPLEASSLDPQQRHLLEVCVETLEHANQNIAKLRGSKTGVFIGVSSNCEFQKMSLGASMYNQYLATGSNSCIASGRISYEFGFNGPAISVDTACSSSLVSTLLAVNSLRNGECDLALSGGVNMMLSPEVISSLCAMNALSEDGRCKPFDANGDGYGRGEGCGMVALKRLSDAKRDGDIIYAVIKGGALNNDGESSGLTVPNGTAQKMVLRDSLLSSNINPDEVTYFEAHGTGTALGDPIELSAIKETYFKDSARKENDPLYIGTVKGNIGHLECGAGIAGIIKTALCIYHGQIVPLANMNEMNPRLSIDGFPIVFPKKVVDWDNKNGKKPRTAAISAFGFSGTNANLILAEDDVMDTNNTTERKESDSYLLKFSAREEKVMVSMMKNLRAYLSNEKDINIADVCFTNDSFRKDESNRAVIIGKNKAEIEEKISYLIDEYTKNGTLYDDSVKLLGSSEGMDRMNAKRTMMNKLGEGMYCAKIDEMINPKMAFVFGDQCDELLQATNILGERHPLFKQVYDECMECFEANGFKQENHTGIEDKMAIFATEYAFARLLESLHIVPEIVYGTGIGKYVAAVISGHLTLNGAIIYLAEYLVNKYSDEGLSLLAGKNIENKAEYFGKAKYRYISRKGESSLRKAEEVVAEFKDYDSEDDFENSIKYIFNQGYRIYAMFGEMEEKELLNTEPLNVNTVIFSNLLGENELVDFIGQVYCNGGNIDFETYYDNSGYQKIVLPTYPFNNSIHWLEPAEKEEGFALYDSKNGLNGMEINLPTISKQFMHVFTYQNFPELADNSGVVHIGYYIELLEKHINSAYEGKKHIIKEMKLSSPIMVFDNEKKDVLLMLDNAEDHVLFKFYSKNHEEKKWNLNVSGKVLFEEGKKISSVDEITLKEKFKNDYTDREQFYKTLVNERGFYFGPAVRFVSDVFASDDRTEAIISFRKCNEQEAKKKYFLGYHPGIVDSCAQSINYIGYKGTEKKFMVSDIGEIWTKGCVNDEDLYCFMTVNETNIKATELIASFDLYNKAGDFIVHIGDMRLKEFDEDKIAMLKNGRMISSNGGRDVYFLNGLLQTNSEERIQLLSEYIRKLFAEAIGMEFEEVDIHEPLDDLGLDSMSGLKFVSDMDEKFGIDLTFSDLVNCRNVYDTAVMVSSIVSGEAVSDDLVVKLKDYRENQSIDSWICNYKENKNSKFRIFCFPNGYNSADMFEGWKEILGDSIEICGIQLPGMDAKRLDEETPEDIDEFVGVLEQVLVNNNLLDKPCAIFGHSWGSLFAYRFAYRLSQNENANIARLFVSAFTSPVEKNSSLVRVLEELKNRGVSSLPTYEETQADADLYDAVVQAFSKAWGYEEGMTKLSLQFLLSALKLIDKYNYNAEEIFEIPIVGFHGVDDYLVAIEEMQKWEQITKGSFKLCSMAGDHQYVNKNQSESELLLNIKGELTGAGITGDILHRY